MGISVLILTHNEEVNLPDCLRSVEWCDDVVVFDSFSTDRTVEIAESGGARVIQNRFENYGMQREAARTRSAFKHDWVLALDADERLDEELLQEMRSVANSAERQYVAFRMRRKDYFEGRWIKHSTLYPSWFIRFFRHEKVRYEPRAVHEYPTVDGAVGQFRGHLLHFSFNKGLEEWRRKHLAYAELEAKAELASLKAGKLDLWGIVSGDPIRRRRAIKPLTYRLPGRAFIKFLYVYVLRGGFLDGPAGFRYCRMLAAYERAIAAKLKALKKEAAGK